MNIFLCMNVRIFSNIYVYICASRKLLFTWVPLWNCGCVSMLLPTINHTWLLYAKQVAWHISPWLRAHRTYTYTHYCWPKTPVLSSWEHVSLFTGSDLRKLTLYKGRWNTFYLIKVRFIFFFFLRKSANWAINVIGQKTEKKCNFCGNNL